MSLLEILKKTVATFCWKLIYLSVDGSDYSDAYMYLGNRTVLSLMLIGIFVMEARSKIFFEESIGSLQCFLLLIFWNAFGNF